MCRSWQRAWETKHNFYEDFLVLMKLYTSLMMNPSVLSLHSGLTKDQFATYGSLAYAALLYTCAPKTGGGGRGRRINLLLAPVVGPFTIHPLRDGALGRGSGRESPYTVLVPRFKDAANVHMYEPHSSRRFAQAVQYSDAASITHLLYY